MRSSMATTVHGAHTYLDTNILRFLPAVTGAAEPRAENSSACTLRLPPGDTSRRWSSGPGKVMRFGWPMRVVNRKTRPLSDVLDIPSRMVCLCLCLSILTSLWSP